MLIAFDSETHLMSPAQPGIGAPPIVCGSFADEGVCKDGALLSRDALLANLRCWLKLKIPLVGANTPYDFGCAAAADPSLLRLIFEAYRDGRVHDVLIRQALIDIGRGTFLIGADGAKFNRYSLAGCVEQNLGARLEKENTWRLRYGELDGTPISAWPEDAREYPRKDAKYTLEVYKAQEGAKTAQGTFIYGDGTREYVDPGGANLALEPYENRAAWALQLMRIWGIRTDPEMVADVTRDVTAKHDAMVVRFTEAGIYRGEGWCRREKDCAGQKPHRVSDKCWKPWLPSKVGTRDGEVLKALVREAYQGAPPMTAGTEHSPPGISTDRDTLEGSGDELLEALAEEGANETEYRTYLGAIARGTAVPINVQYTVIVKTCRASAAEPNTTNVPRGSKKHPSRARQCFVPRNFRDPDPAKRNVLCSVDFPSLELWTQAENLEELFGGSALGKMLQRGDDLHVRLAAMLENVPYEEGLRLKAAKDARFGLMRQAAKPVNYGCWGAMSEEKLVLYCRQPSNGGVRFCEIQGHTCGENKYMSEYLHKPICSRCREIAGEFRAAWFAMLPEARDYFRLIGDQTEVAALSKIEVPAPEGLPRLVCAGRSYTEAANLKFQGRAARLAKDAIWRLAWACYVADGTQEHLWAPNPNHGYAPRTCLMCGLPEGIQPRRACRRSLLYGCRPALFIHDEAITEMPEPLAHDAAWEMAKLFDEAAGYWCPQVWGTRRLCKPALQRRWFKAAEEVKGKDGRLRPWWPPDGKEVWNWGPDQEIMREDLAR